MLDAPSAAPLTSVKPEPPVPSSLPASTGTSAARVKDTRATTNPLRLFVLAAAAAVLLVACEREVETVAQEARPVRTITVDKCDGGAPVVLTGRIEAEDEAALALACPSASSPDSWPIRPRRSTTPSPSS
jgi:hypothetical protein